jgi:hypothetical protein
MAFQNYAAHAVQKYTDSSVQSEVDAPIQIHLHCTSELGTSAGSEIPAQVQNYADVLFRMRYTFQFRTRRLVQTEVDASVQIYLDIRVRN